MQIGMRLPAWRRKKGAGPAVPARPEPGSFDLVRWFAVLSLICIAAISIASAYGQSRFLTDQALQRDATVTKEFIDSIVEAQGTAEHFLRHDGGRFSPQLKSFFNHILRMPDVIAANVYDAKGTALWSSNAVMKGQTYEDNDELATALTGKLIYETGIVGEADKEEHGGLAGKRKGERFVETYVPILGKDRGAAVGVVEIYKIPRGLQALLRDGLKLLWIASGVGAAQLFGSLFWIVQRASRVMTGQQRQLIEMESLAMLGETAAAVTHNIRNPLAAIRASAELALGDDLEGARESARDIIAEADRLNRWTHALLLFSSTDKAPVEAIDINACIALVAQEHRASFEKRNMRPILNLANGLPRVRGVTASFNQVLSSLFENAVTAMTAGGELRIASAPAKSGEGIAVTIADTGPGLSGDLIEKALKPFYTTKPGGTGLGLPLARQIMHRHGGELSLSGGKRGLTVSLIFAAA